MSGKPLNIVWFCTDQQRWDTISALGNKAIRTPNIDRLVKEGTAFSRAYTQSPVCTPSRASFLTGRYPRSTKACYNGNEFFSRDEVLVTKMLADKGYQCGLTGKLHLSSARGRMERRGDDGYSFMRWSHHPHDDWAYGINHYQEWLKAKGVDWTKAYKGRYVSMASWPPVQSEGFSGKEVGIEAQYHQTAWCVEEAINFIDSRKDKSWLVSINTFDPHPPLDPPQEYKDRLKIDDMPLPLWQDGEMENKPPHHKKDYIIGGQNGATDPISALSEEDKREKFRDYYAQIELIDDQLGRLIDYLDANKLRENTLIIFMSDHGEMNGDHGLYWKGAYFYEGIVHIPLLFSCPGLVKQGIVSDALVELVDLAPTILELCGMEIPVAMQGKSLAPILKGAGDIHRHKNAVYCEFYSALYHCHADIFATMYFDGRYKLVVYHGEEWGELYDHIEDPNEYRNLWGEINMKDIKNDLIKKAYDHTVLCNRDFSLLKLYDF